MNTPPNKVNPAPLIEWGGRLSCPQRADIAAGAALRQGATALEALVTGHTAGFGMHCWLKDREQAALLVQRNGRHPHPRSVARARRSAAAKGFLRYDRVGPGQRPKGAKYRSGPGTTHKQAVFRALGVRDPMTRGQLKRAQQRDTVANRPTEDIPIGPRLFGGRLLAAATPRPLPRRASTYRDEFQRMAAPAVEASERRDQEWRRRADERTHEGLRRPRPPD